MTAHYTQQPKQDAITGYWYITLDQSRHRFPTKRAAEVGLLLHEQAAVIEKKSDGISPAAASVGSRD